MKIELTQEQYDELEQIVRDYGGEFRDSYSGRFMYGEKCIGIVHEHDISKQTLLVMSVVTVALRPQIVNDEDTIDPDWIMYELDNLDVRQDSMGMDAITYFPDITLAPGVEDEPIPY